MSSFCDVLRFYVSSRSRSCTTYITHTSKLEIGLQIQNIFTIFWHPFFCNQYCHFHTKISVSAQKSLIASQYSFICFGGVSPLATFCTDLCFRSILQLESSFLKLFDLVLGIEVLVSRSSWKVVFLVLSPIRRCLSFDTVPIRLLTSSFQILSSLVLTSLK